MPVAMKPGPALKRTKYQPTYLKAWREYRNLSQQKLADRVGTTAASISRLENGHQPYFQPLMEALADALLCTVPDLISRDPNSPADALMEQVKRLPREKVIVVRKFIQAVIEENAA